MLRQQVVLTEDLVQTVLVLLRAAVNRKILCYGQYLGRGVNRDGTDEHVVASAAAEQVRHEFHIRWVVGAHVVNAIERLGAEKRSHVVHVRAITGEPAYCRGIGASDRPRLSTVTSCSSRANCCTNSETVELRATHHEHLHFAILRRHDNRPRRDG